MRPSSAFTMFFLTSLGTSATGDLESNPSNPSTNIRLHYGPCPVVLIWGQHFRVFRGAKWLPLPAFAVLLPRPLNICGFKKVSFIRANICQLDHYTLPTYHPFTSIWPICLWNFPWNSPFQKITPIFKTLAAWLRRLRNLARNSWSEKVVENQLWRGSKVQGRRSPILLFFRWNNDHADAFVISHHLANIHFLFLPRKIPPPKKKTSQKTKNDVSKAAWDSVL